MKYRIIVLLVALSSIPQLSISQANPPYIKNTITEFPIFENGSKVYHCKYYSDIFKQYIGYLVYLPKDYFTVKDTVFPVLYYLHGSGSSYSNSKRNTRFWNAAMDNFFPQTVIVSVNGIVDNFYDGNVEKTIIEELRIHILATYRVSDKTECTGIFGISMGGNGALKLGLKYSNIFSQALSINGAFFGDLQLWIDEYKQNGSNKLNICLFGGKLDALLSYSQTAHTKLNDAGIPNNYEEFANVGHDFMQVLNDTAYGPAILHWQAKTFNQTCPVASRNEAIPLKDTIPFVMEDNPLTGLPKPPDSLTSSKNSENNIELKWALNKWPVDGYIVQRSINSGEYKTIDTIEKTNIYIDTLFLSCRLSCRYILKSYNSNGESVSSLVTSLSNPCTNIDNSDITKTESSVFPVPAKDRVYLKLNEKSNKTAHNLKLFNLTGTEIPIKTQNSDNLIEIKLSGIAHGLYFLTFTGNNGVIQKTKIIIE